MKPEVEKALLNQQQRDEYDALIATRDHAINMLSRFEAPRLITGGKRGHKLYCPWCGARVHGDHIVAVDTSERWTYSDMSILDLKIEFDYQGSGDYETERYTHLEPGSACGKPVSEPDGWEMD